MVSSFILVASYMYQQHVIIIVPTIPCNLMHTEPVVAGNMFNVTLTWSRPDPPNGVISQYIVSDITIIAITFYNA